MERIESETSLNQQKLSNQPKIIIVRSREVSQFTKVRKSEINSRVLKFTKKNAKRYAFNKRPMAKKMQLGLKRAEVVLRKWIGQVGGEKNSGAHPTHRNHQRRQANNNKAGLINFE